MLRLNLGREVAGEKMHNNERKGDRGCRDLSSF